MTNIGQPSPESKPSTRWVNVDRIKVDDTYQRVALNERNINKYCRAFTWAAFGALNVADRMGTGALYVVDGQHRLETARRLGITQVPCTVWVSSGREHEAKEFVICNKDRNFVTSYNLYRSSVVEGNPLFMKCEKMLHRLGLHISQSDAHFALAFPATLIKTFAQDAAICEVALAYQRTMIGDQDNMAESIHKGLFGLFRQILVEGSALPGMDKAEKVFRNGGKAFAVNSIRKAQLASGANSQSLKTCAIGIRDALNTGVKRGKIQADLGDVA